MYHQPSIEFNEKYVLCLQKNFWGLFGKTLNQLWSKYTLLMQHLILICFWNVSNNKYNQEYCKNINVF